jgi:murein DD-endopeptidase / murein LD-carboxypeptidase
MAKIFHTVFNLKKKDTGICLILLVSISISILVAKVYAGNDPIGAEISKNFKSTVNGDSIVEFAKTLLGDNYQYGSCTRSSGFDCSGFVYYVFANFGIKIPRTSFLMADFGREIELKEANKGDMIFFTGTDMKNRTVGHVGIIITDKDQPIEFIHSSSSKTKGGVIITAMNSPHYKKRFLKVKRVLPYLNR